MASLRKNAKRYLNQQEVIHILSEAQLQRLVDMEDPMQYKKRPKKMMDVHTDMVMWTEPHRDMLDVRTGKVHRYYDAFEPC